MVFRQRLRCSARGDGSLGSATFKREISDVSARPHCESWHLITVLTVCAAACASQHAKRLKKFFDPFPTLVVCLKQTRVCETVPTPLRAAADRPRAPGTVHGMDAYDRYLALEADRSTLYPPTVPSKSRHLGGSLRTQTSPVSVRWRSSRSRDRNARSEHRHCLCVRHACGLWVMWMIYIWPRRQRDNDTFLYFDFPPPRL